MFTMRCPPKYAEHCRKGRRNSTCYHVARLFKGVLSVSDDEARASASIASLINAWHREDIAEGPAWWPDKRKRGVVYQSPHVLARATMQTSGRS
jgi:hypothetical protein